MEKGYIVINLLPYREKIKREKLKLFGFIIGAFVVGAGLIIFAGSTYMSLQIEGQNERNKYIETKNKQLDSQIKEIAGLKDEIKDTLAKRQVVENLQVDRSDGVNVLNEISRQLPEGVVLKSLKQAENKLSITGTTSANSKIASYMNNLDTTPIFQNSQIVEIKLVNAPVAAVPGRGGKKVSEDIKENEFLITVDMEPKIQAADTDKKAKK